LGLSFNTGKGIIRIDSRFRENDNVGGGNDRRRSGNDPSEARLNGVGIKESENDHREKRLCIHKLSFRFRNFSP
jgi:hypothetical protein